MGQKPSTLPVIDYEVKTTEETWAHHTFTPSSTKREKVGVDIYIYSHDSLEHIVSKLQQAKSLDLTKIFNRGLQVWPDITHESTIVDQWRCRFEGKGELIQLLSELKGLDVIKTENLYTFDGKKAFSNA